jgi:phage terminase small subunit
MSLTHQQEAFAQAVASGKNQSDAYRLAYPKSLKWKPETLWNRASAMMRDREVFARVEAIRAELSERAIWTREESVKVLAGIAKASEKDADRVRATAELNKMHGFEAPQKIEHSGTVTTITRRVVDKAGE